MGSNRAGWPGRGPVSAGPSQPRNGTFRAHARRTVRLQALVTHVRAGWQQQAPVEDVGLGGARIVVGEAVAPGDAVTLSFTAPSLWDPLVIRARVAWVAGGALPYRAGVAFDHRSPDAAFALYELIVTLAYD
ncbi:MAG: PilZ domain-containing protein [Polyangiaceae bacterium]